MEMLCPRCRGQADRLRGAPAVQQRSASRQCHTPAQAVVQGPTAACLTPIHHSDCGTQLPRSSAGKLQRSRLKELAPSLISSIQASPITGAAGAEGERSSEPAPASRGRGTVAGSAKAGNESVSESASRSSMQQSPAGGAEVAFTGSGRKALAECNI